MTEAQTPEAVWTPERQEYLMAVINTIFTTMQMNRVEPDVMSAALMIASARAACTSVHDDEYIMAQYKSQLEQAREDFPYRKPN